jgi:alpha/beta superfamily hydrolase
VAHPRIDGWIAVAPPLSAMPGPRLASADHRPKHLLVAGHDQFSGPDAITASIDAWTNATVTVLASADHFLAGHLAAVGAFVVDRVVADT